MKKSKTYIDLVMEVRRSWQLNPVTRIHDNGSKKNPRKQRREAKESCRNYENSSRQDFLLSF